MHQYFRFFFIILLMLPSFTFATLTLVFYNHSNTSITLVKKDISDNQSTTATRSYSQAETTGSITIEGITHQELKVDDTISKIKYTVEDSGCSIEIKRNKKQWELLLSGDTDITNFKNKKSHSRLYTYTYGKDHTVNISVPRFEIDIDEASTLKKAGAIIFISNQEKHWFGLLAEQLDAYGMPAKHIYFNDDSGAASEIGDKITAEVSTFIQTLENIKNKPIYFFFDIGSIDGNESNSVTGDNRFVLLANTVTKASEIKGKLSDTESFYKKNNLSLKFIILSDTTRDNSLISHYNIYVCTTKNNPTFTIIHQPLEQLDNNEYFLQAYSIRINEIYQETEGSISSPHGYPLYTSSNSTFFSGGRQHYLPQMPPSAIGGGQDLLGKLDQLITVLQKNQEAMEQILQRLPPALSTDNSHTLGNSSSLNIVPRNSNRSKTGSSSSSD